MRGDNAESLRLLLLPYHLAISASGLISDRTAKEQLLRSFLHGEDLTEITLQAEYFAAAWLPKRLRPEMLAKLKAHLAAGHRVVLVLASPDLYVTTIAKAVSAFQKRFARTRQKSSKGMFGKRCRAQLQRGK